MAKFLGFKCGVYGTYYDMQYIPVNNFTVMSGSFLGNHIKSTFKAEDEFSVLIKDTTVSASCEPPDRVPSN